MHRASPAPRRPFASATAVLVVPALVTALAAGAAAGTPRGPAFGSNRYKTEITLANDVDDYVTPLIAGEKLTLAVAADRSSDLFPNVTVLDPDGTDRTPALSVKKGGAAVSFRSLVIDKTGPWVVRLAGDHGTTGTYTAKFQVKGAPAVVLRKQTIGGADPLERDHTFQGVEGARLTATIAIAKGSTGGAIGSVEDPSGAPIGIGLGRKRGSKTTHVIEPLGTGNGAYLLSVDAPEGHATYDLSLLVDVPSRPKGTITLSPLEPKLQPIAGPVVGNSTQVLRLYGQNFSQLAKPVVWFGDKRATVLTVAVLGSAVDVVPPPNPQGTTVSVSIVNPDGQAVVADDYFRYAIPEPAALAKITPGTASVYAGKSLRYTVSLSKAVSGADATIAIEVAGSVGSAPVSITIPAGSSSAGFDLAAASVPASGTVSATYGTVTLAASVSVIQLPTGGGGGGGGDPPPPPLPDEIDISGWTVVQGNSARTFTIPAGTKLKQGDYVVIGRATGQTSFQTYWGTILTPNVHYLTADPTNTSASTDDWPSINGGETYEVRDATGTSVDGASAAMGAAAGENWQRTAGQAASVKASWTVSTTVTPGSAPTPGTGQAPSTTKHGVYISEFSDTTGAGNFVYEFVELHFDGLLGQ
ncbi:MAG: hypothetical protein K8T90_20685 [Planctomycetes bacterium]|nr:hypothetical protein [Planctomycetota bacterium]